MKLNNLYCLVGPSGSGKSTLEELLCKKHQLTPVVSHTTRPMREGEESGKNHIFVSREDFDLIRKDLVAYTEFDGYEYGTTKEMLGRSDIYVIDLEGLYFLECRYEDRQVVVLGLNPGPVTCCERMKARGDSDEEIEERLENDFDDFENLEAYCNVMLDASLDPKQLAAQAWAIIQGYETDFAYPEKAQMLLEEYVANDLESADPDYVREALEQIGCTMGDLKYLGLDWLYPDEEVF